MENWSGKYLLHCPFKSIFGFDCPGCGFQRAVMALLKGNMAASFHLYPATLPILLLALFLLLKMKFWFPQSEKITKALFAIATGTVVISYAFKIARGSFL